MRIKNVLISIIMLGLVAYGGLKLYMYFQAKKDIDALLAPVRAFIDVQYDQISSSIFGPVGIKGIRFTIPQFDETITVGEFKLLSRSNIGKMMNGAIPSRLHFQIRDFKFNLDLLDKIERQAKLEAQRRGQPYPHPSEEIPQVIKRLGYGDIFIRSNNWRELGYSQMGLDLDVDLQFDPETREARFILLESADDMGDFIIDFSFADMSPSVAGAILGVKIKEMKVTYNDHGYMDRFLKTYADEKNMELDAYRNLVAARFEQDMAEKKIKLSADSVKNIKSFIENSNKTLIITAYPYRPVAIESIKHYKPGDVPMLLNLQAHLK